MIIENIDKPLGHQTELLLKSISTRLSGRDDCRGVPYQIKIDENGVRMSPLVYVFKNRYQRKESDKIDVISYIHRYKMHNAPLTGFVFGTYEYSTTVDTKKRRWRRC